MYPRSNRQVLNKLCRCFAECTFKTSGKRAGILVTAGTGKTGDRIVFPFFE